MKLKINGTKMTDPFGTTLIAIFVLLLTVFVLLWPLAVIWALNTLFGFSIPFTLWTWVACWIVIATLHVSRVSKN